MAIYRYCPRCRTGFSLEKEECPRCGAKGQALRYRVLVRSKAVGARSAIVPTLTAAWEMETHFQEEITRAKILGARIQKKKEIQVQEAVAFVIDVFSKDDSRLASFPMAQYGSSPRSFGTGPSCPECGRRAYSP